MSPVVEHSGPPLPPKSTASGDGLTPYLLLLVLALVAAGVFIKQFDFNPAALQGGMALKARPGEEQGFDLAALAPANLKPLGASQVYEPKNLYHKINGKADLYLTAGFERLTARRFSLGADAETWCEAFAYEMKTEAAAFAVYSQQRRPEGTPLALPGLRAYAAGNALYLVKGKLYLELVGGSLAPELMRAMQGMAASLAGGGGGGRAKAQPGEELFPEKGRRPGSLTLHPKGAFGFGGFGPVYTMNFAGGSEGLTAFAAALESPPKALALKKAYLEFLLANGGKRLQRPGLPPGVEVVDMLGAFELVLVRGSILAGVHDCLELEPALALAGEMAGAKETAR